MLLGYAAFTIYSAIRSLYASCEPGGGLIRVWTVADILSCSALGVIFSAVCRSAISASDIPEALRTKLEELASRVDEILQSEEATIRELRAQRRASWVCPHPFGDAPPAPLPPADPIEDADAAPAEPALTSREVVLSTGHHVKVRVPRASKP